MPLEAPMSYEIYDNELLTLRQADSVNEALRYVPGVTPESRSTVTIFDQYTIRGFESYRNYYDGLPLQYNGLWNLVPQVDAFATESIEVLKGPTSVLYGSAPPGGMINQTAKQPKPEQETLIKARVGTNDLRELGLDTTGALNEYVDYRVIALTRRNDGQMKTTEEERHLFAPSVNIQLTEKTNLNLNLYHQQDPNMIPSTPLPATGTLNRANYGWLKPDAYAGDENWAEFDRDITMVGYKFDHAFSDHVSFLQNFRYTDGEAFQKNTYNQGLQGDGRTLNRSAYFTDEEQHGFVIDNQLAFDFNIGQTSHKTLVGVEYQKLESNIGYGDTLGNSTPSINLANPDYNQINPDTLPVDFYTEKHNIDQQQLGLYLQEEMQLGGLTVLGGLRWDRYKSDDDAAYTFGGFPYTGETEISQRETSGRLAAIYTFDNGLAPYLNYSESFEPTSGVDSLTGKPFEPTTAEQVEAGIKYESPNGNTKLTFAYFDIKKQNVVVNTPDFLSYTQTGEVQSKGAELSWTQFVNDKLDFTLSLTHLDVSVTDNELNPALEGKTPVWVAEKQASIWMNYYATPKLELNGGVRYVGESQANQLNTDQVPSYTLVDIAGSYRFNDTYRLGLTVSNLFDDEYVGACFDLNNCWMGNERSVEMTLYATY
jgi:iron complex outermembrane receptor protein